MNDQNKMKADIAQALLQMVQGGFLNSVLIEHERDFDAISQVGAAPVILGERLMVSTPEKISIDALAAVLIDAGWSKGA